MDAPAPHEDVTPFVKVAKHLSELGLRPPEILKVDHKEGFVLLEDLGDNTFTRLLGAGQDESPLYAMATDVLTALHQHPKATAIDLPHYSPAILLHEASLLVDWYYPAVTGERLDLDLRQGFLNSLKDCLAGLPSTEPTLVLRDFHVDNLMAVPSDSGTAPACALLDFQDALIGPAAYDLVSLLEDARRDISAEVVTRMLERYFASRKATSATAKQNDIRWYHVLGAQRHAKVLGIFVRLYVRDGKSTYLTHLPRVMRLLDQHLDQDDLSPLKRWLDDNMPWRMTRLPTESSVSPAQVQAVCGCPFNP